MLWRLSPQTIAFLAPGGLVASMLGVFAAPAMSRRFGKKTSMMFLFGVPVMLGMGIYLVPLMVGTRNGTGEVFTFAVAIAFFSRLRSRGTASVIAVLLLDVTPAHPSVR